MLTDEDLSPRERRHQRTQQAILTAARSILAESGADKLSIRAIADRIDYSPAGLYEYYGSKEEIIGALTREGHLTLKRYMEQVPFTLAPADYLVEIGIAYIQFAVQNPDYFLLIFTSPSARPSAESETSSAVSMELDEEATSFPLLLRGVQRGVEAGVVRYLPGQSLLETAYAFWTIVHGAAMLRISQFTHFQIDFDQTDRLMLAAFVRGMGSQP
jgi:AcrR family transcriptional regulator